jgi:hypothetical protein
MVATPGPAVTAVAVSMAPREPLSGSTELMVVTVAPAVTVVTPEPVVLQELAAEPPTQVTRARMEPPVTAATRATAASAVVVSTGFRVPLRVIAVPRAATLAMAATAARLVRPEPVLAEPTVRAVTAATLVWLVTAETVCPETWEPVELLPVIPAPREPTVVTVVLVELAVRVALVPLRVPTPSAATAVTPGPAVTAAVVWMAPREPWSGSTELMVATVAPAATAVTPEPVVLRALVAEPPTRVTRARMGPRATAATRATVASVEVVSMGPMESTAPLSMPTEPPAPLAVTPVTAATAARSVRPEPALVEQTARAVLAVTRVSPATVASAVSASRA